MEKWHVQSVQSYCFCPLNMQICDVLVALAVSRRCRSFSSQKDDLDAVVINLA